MLRAEGRYASGISAGLVNFLMTGGSQLYTLPVIKCTVWGMSSVTVYLCIFVSLYGDLS